MTRMCPGVEEDSAGSAISCTCTSADTRTSTFSFSYPAAGVW